MRHYTSIPPLCHPALHFTNTNLAGSKPHLKDTPSPRALPSRFSRPEVPMWTPRSPHHRHMTTEVSRQNKSLEGRKSLLAGRPCITYGSTTTQQPSRWFARLCPSLNCGVMTAREKRERSNGRGGSAFIVNHAPRKAARL